MCSQYIWVELLAGGESVHKKGVVDRCCVSTYGWSCWQVWSQYTKRELLTGVESIHMGGVVGRCGISTQKDSC